MNGFELKEMASFVKPSARWSLFSVKSDFVQPLSNDKSRFLNDQISYGKSEKQLSIKKLKEGF